MIYPMLIALMGSYLMTPFVKRLAFRLGAVDYPNKRRINREPIPSLGGLAIYFGVVVALVLMGLSHKFLGVIVGGTLIVILGLLDDLYELRASWKLLGQIIISLVVILLGIRIQFISNPFGGMYYLGLLSIPITLFWLIGVINIINLIDGMDGLAGGVTIIASITLAIFALQQGQTFTLILTLALVGGTLGFLRYNFNPAQIFMGDTGSMFLGFMLAVISITGTLKTVTFWTLLIPTLALGVPIFDALFAILRRKLSGKPIFEADKGHLHHKLLDLGLSQVEAVFIVYLICVFLGMVAIGISGANLAETLFLVLSSVGFMVIGICKLKLFDVDNYRKSYK
ncbi:glycosyltransferase family 4 protein [Halonatronum saccharophilum]|uniref:glycosyltransferase family 4 protein n=1 Tax=Halonatronum saccharophilum TaxID=150060 RepID=UPI0004B0BB69|nr:MraY family glycosyltransferase [Halonatronum saccharophilum]